MMMHSCRRSLALAGRRFYSAVPTDQGERQIYTKLQEHLSPTRLTVKDVSGGCGSAYAVEVSSKQFEGLNVIKQQRLVNSILKEEIKKMHALQLKTSVD